jgi:hypothetical protein
MKLQRYSYRFAEQVLNGMLALKQEVEGILVDLNPGPISRPDFNSLLDKEFVAKGWQSQPPVFGWRPGREDGFLEGPHWH